MLFVDMKYDQIVGLQESIRAAGQDAPSIINDYLKGKGGDVIKKNIHDLLPKSGRHWNGKATAAADTDPFQKTGIELGVRIHSKKLYNYLYFPDDGNTTKKHYGNQQFMKKGAEESVEEISTEIINKLLEKITGGK